MRINNGNPEQALMPAFVGVLTGISSDFRAAAICQHLLVAVRL
jgi:hypothetical protein